MQDRTLAMDIWMNKAWRMEHSPGSMGIFADGGEINAENADHSAFFTYQLWAAEKSTTRVSATGFMLLKS